MVSDLKREEPKFYDAIWARVGDNSREKISSHADYMAGFVASDPHVLLSICRRTHLTEVANGGASMKVRNNLHADKTFLDIKQRSDESLVHLKKRCEDEYLSAMWYGST